MFRGIRIRKQKQDLNRKKKAALEEVSEAQLQACKQAFEFFDKDGEGTISKKELQDALGALGIIATKDDIDRIFIDTTQDENAESLQFDEFVTVWSESLKTQKTQEDILQRAFQFFDRDGNGKLDKSEFMEVLTVLGDPLTEEQVNTFFDAVDDNRDGSLQYDEFIRVMKSELDLMVEDCNTTPFVGVGPDAGGGGPGEDKVAKM